MNDTQSNHQEDIFEEALALLAAGLPLDEVLTEMGDEAEWLRPILEVVAEVGELRQTIPIPPPQDSLERLLNYGQTLAHEPAPPSAPGRWAAFLDLFGRGLGLRLTAGLAAALLIILLFGGGATLLAQDSLPGQPLYGLKRVTENLRLNLAGSSDQREQLQKSFNQRRQTETRQLLEQGRPATVTFEGYVQVTSPITLTVDGLTAYLEPGTMVRGELTPGAYILLRGEIDPSTGLVASEVMLLEPGPPTPTPTPTSTATPTSTPTATSTPTSTPTPTVTPSPTSTPTYTPEPSPSPTSTPTVVIIQQLPTPEPDDNDNGGDNNDNSESDNSGSGSDNSGGDDNDNSDNDNSGSDDDNDNSGGDDNSDDSSGSSSDDNSDDSSGSGSGDDNSDDNSDSGSASDDDDDNSGSGGGGGNDDDDDG